MVSKLGEMELVDLKGRQQVADAESAASTVSSSEPSTTKSATRDDSATTETSSTSRARALSAYSKPDSAEITNISSPPDATTSDSDSSSPTKATSSPLKATAAEFQPVPRQAHPNTVESTTLSHKPSAPRPLFDIYPSGRGGFGAHAARDIKRGTRIMSDSPLLTIPTNHLHLAWGPYCRLGNAQKEQFDTLFFWKNDELNLEQASRMYLLDPTDSAVESDDEEELVDEHVRVMGIFAVNNFEMPKGALGVFPNGARLNHSCVPNVHHSFNPTLGKLTVHAVRDIQEGEELVMNYIGSRCHFWPREKRWEYLRSKYGFTCQCEACSDPSLTPDNDRGAIPALIWGIEEFQKGEAKTNWLIPETPEVALAQAEDVITLFLRQGLVALELARAYRMASSLAMDIGSYQLALEYASNEAEVERNIFGSELEDLKKSGVASELWINTLYRLLKEKEYMPYPKLAAKIYNITGVKHEVLNHKSNGTGPRKGAYKKGKPKKQGSSPKKQGQTQEKEEQAPQGWV